MKTKTLAASCSLRTAKEARRSLRRTSRMTVSSTDCVSHDHLWRAFFSLLRDRACVLAVEFEVKCIDSCGTSLP